MRGEEASLEQLNAGGRREAAPLGMASHYRGVKGASLAPNASSQAPIFQPRRTTSLRAHQKQFQSSSFKKWLRWL